MESGRLVASTLGLGIGQIALTVAILCSASKMLGEMSWPALIAGLVVTMKANWLLLVFRTANRSPGGKG